MISHSRKFISRFRYLFANRRQDGEFDQELEVHLNLLAEKFVRDGMTPEDARYAARRQFGNVTSLRESRNEILSFVLVRACFRDLRYGARFLARNPGWAAIAVLTLALGIGANTTVFSVLDAVLLRPLPFTGADRLVSVAADLQGLGMPDVGLSVAEYEDLRDRAGIFEAISFVWPMDGNLTGVSRPERVEALAVDANYFDMLGVKAQFGRTFQRADIRPGVSEAVVLSDAVWRRAFGGDRKVLGRKIYLDYDTFVIVGVMPPAFRHPGSTLQGDVGFWITGGFGGPPWGARDRRT